MTDTNTVDEMVKERGGYTLATSRHISGIGGGSTEGEGRHAQYFSRADSGGRIVRD